MLRALLPLLALLAGVAPLAAAEPLSPALRAHGGLETWRKFQQLEYDLDWKVGSNRLQDRQLFHLGTRAGRIQCERYVVGGDFHSGVWVMPNEKALGSMPPRFYLWTPFYFFAMPWVFADAGVKAVAAGQRTIDGVEYDVVNVSFPAGAGDAPNDTYTAHFERKTGRLKIVRYTMTYFDKDEAPKKGEARDNAIVFEDWQEVQGLVVPRKAAFYDWKGQPSGPVRGTLDFTNVRFSETEPPAGNFQKPAGAVVAGR